jgi:TATA-binding protein-associated factor Taf7
VKKYLGESGITDATTNIRQRFFRKKPKIDPQLVEEVDIAMDQIKS